MASIVGPLVFSTFYFVVRQRWPGAIWLSALVVNAMAVPLVLNLRFHPAGTAATL
jgi:DHA1 family tetracycline resistance protein-like MFS transporter